jgi:hypothetical protein
MDFHSLSPPRIPSIECQNWFEAGFTTSLIDLAIIRPGIQQRTPITLVKAALRAPYWRVNYLSEENQAFLELCPECGTNVDVRIYPLQNCRALLSYMSSHPISNDGKSEIAMRGRYTSLGHVGKIGFVAFHNGDICQVSFESGLRIEGANFARALIAVTFGTIGINWGVCLGARGWQQFESKYLIMHKNKWLAVTGQWNSAKRRLSWVGSLTYNAWVISMTEQRSPKGIDRLFSSRVEKNGQSVECQKHSNGAFVVTAESVWNFAKFGAWGGIDNRRPWPLFGARVTLTLPD